MSFNYQQQQLHAENVLVADIAQEINTPFYLYSQTKMTEQYHKLNDALSKEFSGLKNFSEKNKHQIYYAVKANSNLGVIAALNKCGAGADVVSYGEMYKALLAGVPAEKIIFSGVGKSNDELRQALEHKGVQINAESVEEVKAISMIAAQTGLPVELCLRVNIDVSPDTHANISTGGATTKFGILIDDLSKALEIIKDQPLIKFHGFAIHIGSMILAFDDFREAYGRFRQLYLDYRKQGYKLDRIDLGGGIGVDYDGKVEADVEHYAQMINEFFGDLDLEISLEPGRYLSAQSGVLVTKILRMKRTSIRTFAVVDAAMNDIIRPMLYQAHHRLNACKLADQDCPNERIYVVGPVCETTDKFNNDGYDLPADISEGDLLYIHDVGAYGAVMASQYNSRLLIPEVMVYNGQWKVIRERPNIEQMLAGESIPNWD